MRGRPTVTFREDRIYSANRTADDQVYASGLLYGDEINMLWDENISDKQVTVTYDGRRLQSILSKIRKANTVRIAVVQVRDMMDKDNFNGPNSSDEFAIYITCGVGGDGREGVKSIAAIRSPPDNTWIDYPLGEKSSMLVAPIKQFRSMIDSFTKCKKTKLLFKFFNNNVEENGIVYKGRPGLIITEGSNTPDKILERYGDIPDDGSDALIPSFQQLGMDESNIFVVDADKIGIFAKLSSLHNEGNVRIKYCKGSHLQIACRIGSFGECEICVASAATLSSQGVQVTPTC